MKWQPIETAPKDGTPILACSAGYSGRVDSAIHPRTVRFQVYHPNAKGIGCFRNYLGHKEHFMTHWMPMLEDPENTTTKEKKLHE